jgi:exopolyphosphatase/pppGpp-phosphohydrolase
VPLTACRSILERLAALPEAGRREVRGLHPDRAPTIVAGVVMVVEALELFDLDAIVVSDHDILRGAALEAVHRPRPNGEADQTSRAGSARTATRFGPTTPLADRAWRRAAPYTTSPLLLRELDVCMMAPR